MTKKKLSFIYTNNHFKLYSRCDSLYERSEWDKMARRVYRFFLKHPIGFCYDFVFSNKVLGEFNVGKN